MLKVALLHFCFEDYTVELANALANYVDLTVIHPYQISEYCRHALDSNIQIYTFKKPRIRDPRNIFSMHKMIEFIRELKPDVLHVQETNDPWYDLSMLLNMNSLPPLVTTIHDIYRHPGDRSNVFASEYTKRLNFYKSKQLIVHTVLLKQTLVERFKISAQCVNVLPHGELGSLYLRQAQEEPIDREPHTILFFGRIWPYKGLQYLVESMLIVVQHIPTAKLIIAGGGNQPRKYLPANYDENHFEILDGFVEPKDVVRLFQRSTAVILPYIESSQSGVAALSYGLGTPVIASNVGGLSEMVRHQQDGILVPPRDVQTLAQAILNLLSDQQLQRKMQVAASSRRRGDLNWLKIASQTIEVYSKI